MEQNNLTRMSQQVLMPMKWPERLESLGVGDSVEVDDKEESAARKAKTRIEKASNKVLTIRRVPPQGNKLYAFRLK